MFTKNSFNGKADPVADAIKAIAESDYALKMEALKGDQTKLDKNKNNKLDADDFKILRGKKKVEEAEDKPRSAGSVFDKDVAKSFQKKEKGEGTGHEAKELKTGTQYTKKSPKEKEETNESFASFKDKLKSGAKKVARVMGGPDDEGHKKDLQKKMGVPQTGKPNHAKYNEEVEFNLEEVDPALVEEFMQTEEFEQLDELSKKTLSSYVKGRGAQLRGGSDDKDKIKGMNTALRKISRKKVNEEVQEISELKKSTLASYAKKATDDVSYHSFTAGTKKASDPERLKSDKKAMSRQSGVDKAIDRLAKEEVGQVEERSLTPAETAEKEKNVKGMKKNLSGFKSRYGSRAKEVMYATATKQAKD